jgi:hypothetical protein
MALHLEIFGFLWPNQLFGPKHALFSSQKTENRLNNMLYTLASIKLESISENLIVAFDDKFTSREVISINISLSLLNNHPKKVIHCCMQCALHVILL